jgi:hypothetical protein
MHEGVGLSARLGSERTCHVNSRLDPEIISDLFKAIRGDVAALKRGLMV